MKGYTFLNNILHFPLTYINFLCEDHTKVVTHKMSTFKKYVYFLQTFVQERNKLGSFSHSCFNIIVQNLEKVYLAFLRFYKPPTKSDSSILYLRNSSLTNVNFKTYPGPILAGIQFHELYLQTDSPPAAFPQQTD